MLVYEWNDGNGKSGVDDPSTSLKLSNASAISQIFAIDHENVTKVLILTNNQITIIAFYGQSANNIFEESDMKYSRKLDQANLIMGG